MNGLVTDTRDFTNKYNTELTPEQESAFQLWATAISSKLGRNVLNDLYDYDMRGAFLDGLTPDGDLHWSDKFKKPNHLTFSDESIYHNVDGYKGGHWSKDKYGSSIFTPSENMLYSDNERTNYWLKSGEYAKGNHLHNAKGDRLLSGSVLIPYDPSLTDRLRTYWYNTSSEEKFMDAISSAVSVISGAGPAFKGLAAAKHAIKPVHNVAKKFVVDLAKGLAVEGAENIVANKIDSDTLDDALTIKDMHRLTNLLRR